MKDNGALGERPSQFAKGRRRGTPDTRFGIRESARQVFAEHGYGQATVRHIARHAGVDPALVLYFFQSKEKLFDEVVVEQLRFMIPPASVFANGPDHVAAPLLEHVLSHWESPQGRDVLLGVMRSVVSHERAAAGWRALLEDELLVHLRDIISKPNPLLRCALVGSQLVGMTYMRYVVRMDPLASMPVTDVVTLLAPVLQHYINGDLTAERPGHGPGRGIWS